MGEQQMCWKQQGNIVWQSTKNSEKHHKTGVNSFVIMRSSIDQI